MTHGAPRLLSGGRAAILALPFHLFKRLDLVDQALDDGQPAIPEGRIRTLFSPTRI